MSAWAQIYSDDISATYTVATTNFEPFPGSTLFTGESRGYRFMKPSPHNTTGICFVTGIEGNGVWDVEFDFSFSGDAGNKTYHAALFKNSSKLGQCSIARKIGTAGDLGAASAGGYVLLNSSTDIIDFRVQAETSGTQITINHINIRAERLSTSTVM